MRPQKELRRRLRELASAKKLALRQSGRNIVDAHVPRRVVKDIELVQETIRWCMGTEYNKARVYFLINPVLNPNGTINHSLAESGSTGRIPANEYYQNNPGPLQFG